MTFDGLLNQPLTIQTIGITGTDSLGNETVGVTATVDTTGYVEQTDASEIVVDRQTYIADWLVALRPDETIGPRDRVVVGSTVLEIVGPPQHVWNPRRQSVHHIDARARSVEG